MFSRNWWVVALRGLLAILFGLLALLWPRLTLLTLVLLFGAYALVDGVFAVISGIASYGRSENWWAVLLGGFVGIAIGFLTLLNPEGATLVLLYYIAVWAMTRGIFEIASAVQMRRLITGEWLMILNGIFSILFGVLVFFFPGAGALSVIWIISLYALAFGILMILLAFRLRSLRGEGEPGRPTHA